MNSSHWLGYQLFTGNLITLFMGLVCRGEFINCVAQNMAWSCLRLMLIKWDGICLKIPIFPTPTQLMNDSNELHSRYETVTDKLDMI